MSIFEEKFKYGLACTRHGYAMYPTIQDRDAIAITHGQCPGLQFFRIEMEDGGGTP